MLTWRHVLGLVSGLLLLVGQSAVAAPAQAVPLPASHSGSCTTADSNAVTVVIDFGGLGGGVRTYCATGLARGATGADALRAAGISYVGTSEDGRGLICRLLGRPSSGETIKLNGSSYKENCVNTPPTGAHWSYWSAHPGGSWSYNSSGVRSHRVILGGYEGWSFSLGKNRAPGASPAAYAAPKKPSPKKPSAKKATPKKSSTNKKSTKKSTAAKASAATPKKTTAAKPAATSKKSTTAKPASASSSTAKKTSTAQAKKTVATAPASAGSAAPLAAAPSVAPLEDPAASTASASSETGVPAGMIAGGAAIVVIGAGAAVVTIRRRRS